jgi:hypothetical protein
MESSQKEATPALDADAPLIPVRRVAAWVLLAGVCILGTISFYLIIKMSQRRSDFYAIAVRHFLVVVGLPMAALAAMFVVLLFRVVTGGNISVSVLGLKFEGAAGPVIMWVICFLAIVLAFDRLWNEVYEGPMGSVIGINPWWQRRCE